MQITAEQVLDGAPGATVLTMDFFDTMVTRSVAQPTHVFAVMEDELCREQGSRWIGFAYQRVMAEHTARRITAENDEFRDVTIDDIYRELAYVVGLSMSERHGLIARECETEIRLAQPVVFGQEITEAARRRGMRIVVVSDNYMASSHIVKMAHAAGYDWLRVDDVFVSCEHGGMKHNGKLWEKVVHSVGADARNILHVGDDHIADHEVPQFHGIRTFVRDVMRRTHRAMENTTPGVLPLSRFEATLRDAHAMHEWPVADVLGHGAVALIVASQIADVKSVLAQRDIAGIHFVARDGYLAHVVWNQLRDAGHNLPEASYTAVSRSVIWRACLTRVDGDTIQRFIGDDERLTIERLERRVGCSLTSSHHDCSEVSSVQARDILLDNADAIVAACRELRTRLEGYLEQQGLLRPGHHLVIDLGWTGSTIADLAHIVHEASGGVATLEGRLMGMYWDAVPHRARVPLHGYAMDDFKGIDNNVRLLGCQSVFESLLTAPHGSVIGYDNAEHNFSPVFVETHVESEAYESHMHRIGECAVESAFRIADGSHLSGVTLADLTGDVAWATMMQVGHTPRADETAFLSAIRHVTSIDHEGNGDVLIAPTPHQHMQHSELGAIYDQLIHHHWVQASLNHWTSEPPVRWIADEIRRMWPVFQPTWVQIP